MGSSPSREVPQENGEEAERTVSTPLRNRLSSQLPAQRVNASKQSTRMSRQTESPSYGIKRKRKRVSQGEPQPKKQKSSPLPTLELPNNSRASSPKEEDGDDDGTLHSTTKSPSRTSDRPISKKNRKIKIRTVVPPQANKDQDEDSIPPGSESLEASEADKPRSHADTESHLTCTVCGRQFINQKHLMRHMRNPNVHRKRHTCTECKEVFFREEVLKSHQESSGHQSRVSNARGPFTDSEKAKLDRFKRRICNDYSVSEFDFNTLMTLLGRRDGSDWPNPDVTRAELRSMFYDVLPDRTRKSLNRYRERYFQNVEKETEWTEEQINALRDLVQEKGRKWVEIAEILGRTQDSVYQKWKNRIRQGDAQRFERWEEDEKEALILAVRECKIAAKVPLDFSSDDKVNWTAVSDRLEKRRNAQQCSTFWKRVYRPREEAKARGQDLKPIPPGRSRPEPTQARHQTRRKATRGGKSVELVTPRGKVKSAMYVTESDEEGNTSVRNTRSKNGNQRPNPETRWLGSSQGSESDEYATTKEQERSHDHEDEDRSDNHDEVDSPSKRSRGDRLIEVLIPLPSTSKQSSEQQKTINGSSQAVNRRDHEPDDSSSRNRTDPPVDSETIPPRSSHNQKTPRLPPLSKRTPRKVTTLSQAFNNTQAPTSPGTAEHSTPSRHPREDRPSPNIQIQPRPILEEELSFQGLKGEDDGQAQQQELTGAGFAIFESETEDSDKEQPPEPSSSAAPSSDGVESKTTSDSEPQLSDDEQPLQMFSSVAPGIQNDAESVESSSEESSSSSEEEEEPIPMFSSAALPLPVSRAARQANNINGSEITEEAEGVEEEDDEPPPQIFTSALPTHEPAAQSETSTSSGDAPTIFPDESDSDDDGEANAHTTGTGTGSASRSHSGSGSDDTDTMVDAAQDDFFANLEASARKVKALKQRQEMEMEMQMKLWRANLGPKVAGDGMAGGSVRGSRRGEKKRKKGVFEVSSSSSSSSGGGEEEL